MHQSLAAYTHTAWKIPTRTQSRLYVVFTLHSELGMTVDGISVAVHSYALNQPLAVVL